MFMLGIIYYAFTANSLDINLEEWELGQNYYLHSVQIFFMLDIKKKRIKTR